MFNFNQKAGFRILNIQNNDIITKINSLFRSPKYDDTFIFNNKKYFYGWFEGNDFYISFNKSKNPILRGSIITNKSESLIIIKEIFGLMHLIHIFFIVILASIFITLFLSSSEKFIFDYIGLGITAILLIINVYKFFNIFDVFDNFKMRLSDIFNDIPINELTAIELDDTHIS